MRHWRNVRIRLLGSAILAPALWAGPGAAQQEMLLTDDQIALLTAECQALLRIADPALESRERREEIAQIAAANEPAQCIAYVERFRAGALDEAGAAVNVQALEPVNERAVISEEVQIEREAIVEGEVVVRQAPAEVTVQPAPPEVAVTPGAPDVTVREQPAEIVVRQQQPTITVAMPQPTIRVQMPAPEIYITMANPEVAVSAAEPQVEVRQGEPAVEVLVPDPEVAVNVDARLVDPNDPQAAALLENRDAATMARIEPSGEQARVTVTPVEPRVSLAQGQAEPRVSVQNAEPVVRFEAAEPRIEVVGQPEVQFEQMGEPRITFETAEQREQRLRQETSAQAGGVAEGAAGPANQQETAALATDVEGAPREDLARRPEITGRIDDRLMFEGASTAAGESVTVGDLMGYDVVNAQGEDLGDVDRIVANGDRLFLVLAHGGFLGLGEQQVALPLANAEIRDDRLVLSGVDPESLERMPEYDSSAERRLDDDTAIRIMR